jgi:hypothetical protein
MSLLNLNASPASYYHSEGHSYLSFNEIKTQCGPTFCDSLANLYNAANTAGRKQNTKIMVIVKIKK